MAAITNDEAIRFINEQIRPMAEQLRNLNALLNNLQGMWVGGGISAYFSNGSDTVEDGRENEGVSRLTADDINNLATEIGTIISQFAGAGVMDTIRKPCVRLMTVGSN